MTTLRAGSSQRWPRRLGLALLGLLVGFLCLRGVVSIAQQSAAPTAPVDAAPPPVAAPAVLSKEQRRARAQALVQRIGDGNARVVEVFSAPSGMTGVVLDTGSGRLVAWMPDNHEVLFIGAAFDRTGLNVSQAEMVGRGFATPDTVPPTATAPAAAAQRGGVPLRAFEKSTGFVEGAAGPTITAFVDLNCGYCSQLWRQLRAPIAAGQLRVRWVPVAVVAPDSEAKAASLLQAADPVTALAAHESRRTPLVPQRPSPAVADGIAANNALLEVVTNGRPATPVLVARAADQQPVIAVGLPPDLAAFLKEAR